MMPKLPRLPQLILSILIDESDCQFALADLAEEFAAIVSLRGRRAAVRWYWMQMFRSILPCLRQRLAHRTHHQLQPIEGMPEGKKSMQRRITNLMETMISDIRYGFRGLIKSPVFTAVAVLSLALGIGANTAIFSMIDAMLLRTLPVKDPGRLVSFSVLTQRGAGLSLPYPFLERVRKNGKSFDGVLATSGSRSMRLKTTDSGDQFDKVRAEPVTGNFFDALGVNAVIGRALSEDDDRPNNANDVVVISYNLWKTRFALDTGVIGKNITLDDRSFTIVGVAAPAFSGVQVEASSDLWFPLWLEARDPAVAARMTRIGSSWLMMMARLKPGVSMKEAQAEIDVIYRQMLVDKAGPSLEKWTESQKSDYFANRAVLQAGAAGFSFLRLKFAQPLFILMTIVGLVLLIACANVANLLLARAATRQREVAVRLAIGAGRLRLIRQLLTESILLAMLGGTLGLVFSHWAMGLLMAFVKNGQQQVSLNLSLDLRVLGFTVLISVLTGLLFGLAPALRATGLDLIPALKETAGTLRMGGSRLAIDKILVVAQVALSLFLLIGAGLFVRTLQNLKSVSGFDAENVLVFSIDVKPGYTAPQRVNLYQQVLSRLETLPGTRTATISNFYLLRGDQDSYSVSVPGYSPKPDENTGCSTLLVGPKFFETMGIPILMGRDFTQEDNRELASSGPTSAILPAIINQTMAEHFFGNDNPIGRQFSIHEKDKTNFEIVGVVKDSKYQKLRETTPRVFYTPLLPAFNLTSLAPAVGAGANFEIRTFGNPTATVAAIQHEVRSIDKDSQVSNINTMVELVDQSIVQERFIAQVASFFSLFALLLASLGLYGILSYGVARRTKEMGIRMALGAESGNVIWLIMRESLLLVIVGVAIGVPAALLSVRFVSGYLFGLSSNDPVTIAVATFVLLIVAMLAGYLPARRASRIDPMIALRYE